MSLDFRAIQEAHERVRGAVHRTPVLTSRSLDVQCGARLFFKCENFQKTGSFKARGATNAVFSLDGAEAAAGVVTHSSGNHGAALAHAAALLRVPAHVVMPSTTTLVKQSAVRHYGGQIVSCGPTLQAREEACAEVMARTHATLVHPYNDVRVMAGQGTAVVELLQDVPELDHVLVPVGGGGLLSGTAVAAKAMNPGVRVIGVEPREVDDARRSFVSGELQPASGHTVAEGLRTALGTLTFPLIRRHVDDIVLVSEDAIVQAMRILWNVLKIVVEPSAAVPYAAVLERGAVPAGAAVGIILSGGNVDVDRLPWTV